MIFVFEQVLREKWSQWFGMPEPKNFSFLKISGNPLAEGRIVFLVFKDHDRQPCVVIKSLRDSNSLSTLQREQEKLKHIHSLRDNFTGIPIPLWCESVQGQWFSIETAITGKLMGNMRSPWIATGESKQTRQVVTRDFTQAFQWIGNFHQQTQHSLPSASQDKVESLILETILGNNQNIDEDPKAKIASDIIVKRITASFVDQHLPLVCEHGDFWAGNIYLTQNGIGVIDWSDAEFDRLPVLDLAFFTVSYTLGFAPVQDNRFWMFENLLTHRSTWFSQLVEESYRNYYQKMNIPEVSPFYLIGLALLRRCVTESNRPVEINPFRKMLNYWIEVALEQPA